MANYTMVNNDMTIMFIEVNNKQEESGNGLFLDYYSCYSIVIMQYQDTKVNVLQEMY